MEGEDKGVVGEVRSGRERGLPLIFWMSPRVQSNNVARLCCGLRFILSVLRALKNPTKCLLRGSPTVGSTSFFSPPAHLCAVSYNYVID